MSLDAQAAERAAKEIVMWISRATPNADPALEHDPLLVPEIAAIISKHCGAASVPQPVAVDAEVVEMLRLRKELDPDAPDAIVLTVGGGWQPIETAPKDGTRVLVDFGRVGIHAVAWQQSISGTTGWCVDDLKFGPYALRKYISTDMQGWMPLPTPPQVQLPTKEGE